VKNPSAMASEGAPPAVFTLFGAYYRQTGSWRLKNTRPQLLQNLVIYLTPPTPTGCGLVNLRNGTGSI